MAIQPFTTEEIKTLLEICRFRKKALLDRILLIAGVVECGEKLRFGTVHLLVGEEKFNRWVAESGAGEAAIQELKDEIQEVEEEMSNLEAQL